MTLQAWIKLDTLADGTIVYKNDGAGPWWFSYELYIDSASGYYRPYFQVNPDWYMSNLNSGELSTDTWYHLAGVHSGTDLKLYIDGSNTNVTNAITGGTLYDSAAEFSVGFPWGAPIDGIIDEVRLSSEARSESWLATETNNLSNQGTGSGKFIKTVDSEENNNPPTSLYRSVGNSATALASGSGNALTILGSTATFGSVLSDSIGVGDAIQYDSDGNDTIDAIAFIHGRTDSQTYTVKDKDGATPTAVTGDNELVHLPGLRLAFQLGERGMKTT